jgi:hypothetical protein
MGAAIRKGFDLRLRATQWQVFPALIFPGEVGWGIAGQEFIQMTLGADAELFSPRKACHAHDDIKGKGTVNMAWAGND